MLKGSVLTGSGQLKRISQMLTFSKHIVGVFFERPHRVHSLILIEIFLSKFSKAKLITVNWESVLFLILKRQA